jgi:hypothetical protein
MKIIERKKENIKLFIGRKMILSSMNRSLVGIGDQQLRIKDSNVILLFSLMREDLL